MVDQMMEDDFETKAGTIISGKADAEDYEHGMLIHFDTDSSKLAAGDLLLISTPSGGRLSLVPVDADGDSLIVSARVNPYSNYHFKLVPVDARTRRLEMEPHHIELLASRRAR